MSVHLRTIGLKVVWRTEARVAIMKDYDAEY